MRCRAGEDRARAGGTRATSPRRRCGRCRDTRAASGAAALTRCSARAPHARREPPTLACSSGARDGPAQECQGRRRQQQQQQLWQSDRLHQRRQQQPRGPERDETGRTQEWEERRTFWKFIFHMVYGHCTARSLDISSCGLV